MSENMVSEKKTSRLDTLTAQLRERANEVNHCIDAVNDCFNDVMSPVLAPNDDKRGKPVDMPSNALDRYAEEVEMTLEVFANRLRDLKTRCIL